MALQFPHNYAVNSHEVGQEVSKQNLDKLLNKVYCHLKLNPEDILTQQALKDFKFIQDNTPGHGHRCMKWTASIGSTCALTALPIAGVAAGGKYAYDHIPDAVADLTKTFQEQGIQGVTAENPYKTALMAGLSGLVAAEAVARRYNTSIVNPIANLVVGGYVSVMHRIAGGIENYFDHAKAKREEQNKEAHDRIVKQQIGVYDGVAGDLYRRFEEAKNDPQALVNLKAQAAELQAALTQFEARFKDVGINTSEANLILDKFRAAIKSILDEKISLRSGTTQEDLAYNAKLLINFPITAEHCITSEAHRHIEMAKSCSLGILHTIKHGVSTLASGALGAAAVPAGAIAYIYAKSCELAQGSYIPTCDSQTISLNNLQNQSTTLLAGVTAGAVAVGGVAAALVSRSYQKEREASDSVVAKESQAARQDLICVYEGLAGHFRQQLAYVKNNRQALVSLKRDAEGLLSKLEEIHFQLQKSGIRNLSPERVTHELNTALVEIRSA